MDEFVYGKIVGDDVFVFSLKKPLDNALLPDE